MTDYETERNNIKATYNVNDDQLDRLIETATRFATVGVCRNPNEALYHMLRLHRGSQPLNKIGFEIQ